MAASSILQISLTIQNASSTKVLFFSGASRCTLTKNFQPCKPLLPSSGIGCSARRRGSGNPAVTSKKINKKQANHKNVGEDEDIDEDAFDALFHQLEEDLKNDELFGNGGEYDDISDEDLAKLGQELAEALEDDELFGALNFAALGNIKSDVDDNDGEEDDDDDIDIDDDDDDDGSEVDDDEEETPLKLKNWQLRRLAHALKKGRRKTSIKSLAADLCLDRAVVLKLLRDPPPNLVMMSAALPDKPETTTLDPVEKRVEAVPEETITHVVKPQVKVKVPVHVMQSNWSARKRLKKVQLETLEQVYKRSKRPTNAIISSIVHVTNLPRRRVVKWFEDKRAEEGLPEHRRSYQRPPSESVFTS